MSKEGADLVHDYVATLTSDQRRQIMTDWELLEKQGYIGECYLRQAVREMVLKMPAPAGHVIRPTYAWLKELAFGTYRHVARDQFFVRSVYDSFKKDLEQGYRTKDKEYAVDLLGRALGEKP